MKQKCVFPSWFACTTDVSGEERSEASLTCAVLLVDGKQVDDVVTTKGER